MPTGNITFDLNPSGLGKLFQPKYNMRSVAFFTPINRICRFHEMVLIDIRFIVTQANFANAHLIEP